MPESRSARRRPTLRDRRDEAAALEGLLEAVRGGSSGALVLHGQPGIETALYGHDAVLEAAVVGRPDDVLGEVVVAYVALRPEADISVDELHDLWAERLAKHKRPVIIEVLKSLPKNAVGKIDKPTLRRLAALPPHV